MDEKFHEMVLEKTHTSGVEEWYCPDCGRRFLVQWPPAYKMIIVEPGEKDTRHNVSKSHLRQGPLKIPVMKEIEPIEEFRLSRGYSGWRKWISTAGGVKAPNPVLLNSPHTVLAPGGGAGKRREPWSHGVLCMGFSAVWQSGKALRLGASRNTKGVQSRGLDPLNSGSFRFNLGLYTVRFLNLQRARRRVRAPAWPSLSQGGRGIRRKRTESPQRCPQCPCYRPRRRCLLRWVPMPVSAGLNRVGVQRVRGYASHDKGCTCYLASLHSDQRGNAYHCITGSGVTMLQIGAAHAGHISIGGDCDGRQHLIALERCCEEILEEFFGFDLPLTIRTGSREGRVQCCY